MVGASSNPNEPVAISQIQSRAKTQRIVAVEGVMVINININPWIEGSDNFDLIL